MKKILHPKYVSISFNDYLSVNRMQLPVKFWSKEKSMHYTTKFNFGRNKLFCHGWCRKEQKLERRLWSDLPLDIINLIADRLYYVYQIRFQAVCKSREAADIVQYGDKLPWLMGIMHTHVISTKNTLFSIVPETEQFLLVQHHLIKKMIGSFSREIIKFPGGEKRSFTLFLHTFH